MNPKPNVFLVIATAVALALAMFASIRAQIQGVPVPSYTDAQAIAATLPVIMPVYDQTGSQKTPSHMATGRATLSLGSATITLTNAAAYTGATTYFCVTNDQNLTAVLSSVSYTSGSSFTIHGTLSDTVSWFCLGW